MTRCVISDADINKSFWAEAVTTANYVINRCPSRSLGERTPFELLFNAKPDVSYFKVFDCKDFSHIPKDERSKLDFRSRSTLFMGYGDKIKGYRLYDIKK